ncbi:hypothetical protein NQ318_008261 [Aromia moschata]|uniref:L-type lectin-like domain-containing protein n=1 Tax=Aromia moschata TaxID=1265417 RepID=A0AAV8Y7J6_9CUCU|nr:hypothetical protein NQ318_008261 [Aromia moschata]
MCLKEVAVSFLLLLLTNLISAAWNTKDFMKREHSLIKPYYGSGIDLPFWQFMGSTIVTPNYIRLTDDTQSKRGAIWNTVPVNVRNWELQVHFKVHGRGKDLFGDGFAIWYARDPMIEGPVFGSKDNFYGLAVILDTYSNHNGPHNHQHPYISAMINNGTLSYDHDRDGTHTQLAGCEAKFRNFDHDTHVLIRYEKDVLTVSTDIENKAAWKECFEVKGVRLPTGYHIGVTATTGDLSDNHDIMSIRLFELDLPDDIEHRPISDVLRTAKRSRGRPKPSSLSGIKIFFLMLLGSIAIVACVVMGIMFYQKQQEKSRKRFY